MPTLKLLRLPEAMIDSSSVDSKYQPDEMKLLPHKTQMVIGRNNAHHRPDYCIESALNNRMISRKHATIEHSAAGFKLFDHSLNGTYVNYSRSSGSVLLQSGQIVIFGHLNGANIKPGEKVPEYNSDLKYRVEIVDNAPLPPPTPPVVMTSASALSSGSRSKLDSSSTHTAAATSSTSSQSRKRPSTAMKSGDDSSAHASPIKVGGKKRDILSTSLPSTAALSSSASTSSGGGVLSGSSKQQQARKSSGGGGGGSSASHAAAGSASFANALTAAAAMSGSSKAKSSSLTTVSPASAATAAPQQVTSSSSLAVTATTALMVDNMYHYENDQCNAKPCVEPKDANINWIQCDLCNNWYHQICVGISDADEVDENETYACPYCKKK